MDRPDHPDYRVLVLDDDFRVAALHRAIVEASPGFKVAATVGTCAAARQAVTAHPDLDLALVDVHLPDGSGLDLLAELPCDALVLAAENDSAAVRAAVRAGALAFLIKPFDADELARRLQGYRRYRRLLDAASVDQTQLDRALQALRSGSAPREGLSQTEEAILAAFTDGPLFADDVAARVGIAPPTARRHLAKLVTDGRLRMRLQYGATGRPRQEYRLT